MSSATPYDPQEAWAAASAASTPDVRMRDVGRQLGLTSRQRALGVLWARYRCLQHDGKKVAWDGTQSASPDETEQIATSGFLPPGFVDTSGASLPIRFRRPSAPYHLFRVVVDRFTALLFNERRHPQVRLAGDENAEAFARALWDTARGWAAMMKARAYGGAQGTVAVGFQFVKGRPQVEVHDPRWLFPEFSDRFGLTLRRVEKRLQYPQDVMTERGWETRPMWFRRVVDEFSDTTFRPAEVSEREPEWEPDPAATFEHGLGFCPVVWVQNLPVDDDVDGAPDCEGCVDVLDEMDRVLSQTCKGTTANADPTLLIKADGEFGSEIQTGSDGAIKLPASGDARYLELAGSSIEMGLKVSAELRRIALEVAQCVLDAGSSGDAQKTATQVDRDYSSMLAKGGMLREQYGQKLVLPLLTMMMAAAKKMSGGRVEGGQIVRGGVRLSGWKGQKTEGGLVLASNLPDEPDLELQWPDFFEPSLDDVSKATTAAVSAKAGKVVDGEHATKFLAPYFRVEDPDAMLEEIAKEPDVAAGSIAGLNAAPRPPGFGGGTPAPPGGFVKGTTVPAKAG